MESCFITQVILYLRLRPFQLRLQHREHLSHVDCLLEVFKFWVSLRLIWVCHLLGPLAHNGSLQLKKRAVGKLQFHPAETGEFKFVLLRSQETRLEGESCLTLFL